METVTHPSPKKAWDLYLTVPWPALCSEVAKLRISHPAATPLLHSEMGAAGIERASRRPPRPIRDGATERAVLTAATKPDGGRSNCSNAAQALGFAQDAWGGFYLKRGGGVA